MNKDSHATFPVMIYLTDTLKYPLILQTCSSATISGGLSLQEDLLPSLDPQPHPTSPVVSWLCGAPTSHTCSPFPSGKASPWAPYCDVHARADGFTLPLFIGSSSLGLEGTLLHPNSEIKMKEKKCPKLLSSLTASHQGGSAVAWGHNTG